MPASICVPTGLPKKKKKKKKKGESVASAITEWKMYCKNAFILCYHLPSLYLEPWAI